MAGRKAMTVGSRAKLLIQALDDVGNDTTKPRLERARALCEAEIRSKVLREIREDLGLELPPPVD